ncbi:WYL domain-containing protein [Novispirillum itersonii subsp. nipponicum]
MTDDTTGTMPRKSPDKTATARIITLYRILETSRHPLTKKELAERLDCSSESVRRLLHTLDQELGDGVLVTETREQDRVPTHSLRTTRPHPLQGLADVVDLFAQWVDQVAPYLPEQTVEQARSALPQLAITLSDGGPGYGGPTQTAAPRWPMTFRSKGYIDYIPHAQTLKTLRQAITGGQVCVVGYHAAGQDAPRRHRLIPRRIVVQSGTLYLLGDALTEGTLQPEYGMTLSVHRIRTVDLKQEYLRPQAADDGMRDRHFGLKWHAPRRCAVWIAAPAADYVRDRIWSDDQTITSHTDGSLTLHVTTTSEEELKAWVRSFGDRARLEDTPLPEQESA